MRLIPGKTKVRLELFKGVSLTDIAIGAIAMGLMLLVFVSNFSGKFYICLGITFVAATLLVRLDSEPCYVYIIRIFRHLGYKKNFTKTYSDNILVDNGSEEEAAVKGLYDEKDDSVKKDPKDKKKSDKELYKEEQKILKSKTATKEEKDAVWLARAKRSAENKNLRKEKKEASTTFEPMEKINAFTGIKDGYIEYGGDYYGVAIEIPPIEFRFFSEMRRNNSIENGVGRILRSINPDYSANIIKIERPVLFDKYVDHEYDKLDELKASFENGVISEDELKTRVEVVYDRINELLSLCNQDYVIRPYYYLVLFDDHKNQLDITVQSAFNSLQAGELSPKILDDKELAVFLKYTNDIDFDEHDVEKVLPENYAKWAMPDTIRINHRTIQVNRLLTHNFNVVNYPAMVDDGWMAELMSIPATKVVMKFRPMDRTKSIRAIDHSLQEIDDRLRTTGIESRKLELAAHRETLSQLLLTLQGDNETLLGLNIYITAYDVGYSNTELGKKEPIVSKYQPVSSMRKMIRRYYSENRMRLENMDFNQMQAFIGSQVSGYDPGFNNSRGVPSNSIAAAFPWVFPAVADEKGTKFGYSGNSPVFIDFFRRDSERVNSNMVIVGKSGSGKSYATKSFLTNLAADGAKIFILDPENEYSVLAENLHGKIINVGNATHGRLNPFHIITALDDDENEDSSGNSYATHLQFLEEFFKQSLPDCEKNALEYLNMLIDRMYLNKGITQETNLSKLKPEDYPVFDDLYDTILTEFQITDNEYIRTMLRSLMNYISKYSTGGRNSTIWNGPSSVTTEENFTVFNFQSLLANRNTVISNSQMLLVLKYIDNEIIKNRDYNLKYHANRKIVVVIDEAHVFIDTKYPVALDFMFQLAKRIRKYNGMQIVITQNIKDFIGSEEIARKSTAIINACQYSFIFALSPNDMDDLCTLYEKAGGINEIEQEQIVSAPRGQAFAVLSPQHRTTFNVQVQPGIADVFDNPDFVSGYFSGDEGYDNWEDYIGDSRTKRELNNTDEPIPESVETEIEKIISNLHPVEFNEISGDEYSKQQAEIQRRLEREKQIEDAIAGNSRGDEIVFVTEDDTHTKTVAVQAQQPAVSSVNPETEALAEVIKQLSGVVDNIGRMNYDAIMDTVRRMISGNESLVSEDISVPVSEPVPKLTDENVFGDMFGDDEEYDEYDGYEEEDTAEQEIESEEAVSHAESENESSGISFNIFDFIASQASEFEVDDAENDLEARLYESDDFITVSLEELVKYNLGKISNR